jgi:hypothetical protein
MSTFYRNTVTGADDPCAGPLLPIAHVRRTRRRAQRAPAAGW